MINSNYLGRKPIFLLIWSYLNSSQECFFSICGEKTKPIVDKDGDYTKENIRGEYASLDNFIRQWREQDKKEEIRDLLRERGIDLESIKADQNMKGVDDFDFICHVAFDAKPHSENPQKSPNSLEAEKATCKQYGNWNKQYIQKRLYKNERFRSKTCSLYGWFR